MCDLNAAASLPLSFNRSVQTEQPPPFLLTAFRSSWDIASSPTDRNTLYYDTVHQTDTETSRDCRYQEGTPPLSPSTCSMVVRCSWADTVASICRTGAMHDQCSGQEKSKATPHFQSDSPAQAMAKKGSGVGGAQATTQLLFVLFWAASQSKQSRVGK